MLDVFIYKQKIVEVSDDKQKFKKSCRSKTITCDT